MKTNNILLVEDDPNLGLVLSDFLKTKCFEVQRAFDGKEGLKIFNKGTFDICILDVMMPIKDGFTLAKEIREVDKKIPIIFLTAKSLKEDKMEGFKLGGDDYITKPFSMEELTARINAILRRTKTDEDVTNYKIGEYTFNTLKRELTFDKETNKLTAKENEIIKLLIKNKNKEINRNSALRLIWGDDSYFNSRSMDVYMSKVRKLLNKDKKIEIINIHGIGFKLICE